ncbi:MAG: hypothetical protein QOJ18_959 [Microbacteriaceae bacterium]|nr:hypothetical protein [Microbacteriaceae bacterium]
MTLTHIIPSLRRTIASPWRRDLWPEFTTTSTVDVTIAGVSLLRLVDWCGTPCVHTAAAVTPRAGGRVDPRASDEDATSVIVAKVIAVEPHDDAIDVWIDADLSGCNAFPSETRMIGRVSTAHDTVIHLRSGSGNPSRGGACSVPIELGSDIHFGDLLAIPCAGTTCLHEIDPNHLHRAASAVDEEKPVPPTSCGK